MLRIMTLTRGHVHMVLTTWKGKRGWRVFALICSLVSASVAAFPELGKNHQVHHNVVVDMIQGKRTELTIAACLCTSKQEL